MDPAELANRFDYHQPPDQLTIDAHQQVRSICREAALGLNAITPESREKSLALTAVQETMMWANAAIAIHNDRLPEPSFHGYPGDRPEREATPFSEMGATVEQPDRHSFRPVAPRSETCTCSRRKSDPIHTAQTERATDKE